MFFDFGDACMPVDRTTIGRDVKCVLRQLQTLEGAGSSPAGAWGGETVPSVRQVPVARGTRGLFENARLPYYPQDGLESMSLAVRGRGLEGSMIHPRRKGAKEPSVAGLLKGRLALSSGPEMETTRSDQWAETTCDSRRTDEARGRRGRSRRTTAPRRTGSASSRSASPAS